MKTSKKILLGLGLVTMAVFGLLSTVPSDKVYAQPSPPPLNITNPRFTNATTIVLNLNGNSVTFTSSDGRNFRPTNINENVFCDNGIESYGINLLPTQEGEPQRANIRLGYWYDNPSGTIPRTCEGPVTASFDIQDPDDVGPCDPDINPNCEDETCEEGDPGCVCEGEGDDQICTSGPVDDNSRCVDAGSTLMEWFLCPLTTGIGSAVDQLNGWIEGLLTIDTEELFTDEVKEVWSAIRIIATSLLVIVMLVMIISQAIGRGPFA